MKIVVCVKRVGGTGDDEEPTWELNDWDRFALEAALELRDAHGGEVVAITVDDEGADEMLLDCLATGADRAVRIWDAAIEPEPLSLARALAGPVGREQPDLVLCGAQSSDAANGATGTALAGLLDLARVAVVRGLRYDETARAFEVDRELEGGLVERVRAPTPVLLTVQTGINRPRRPNLRAIKRAGEKPREVLGLAEAGVDPAELVAATGSRVRRLAAPERGAGAEMLDGDARRDSRGGSRRSSRNVWHRDPCARGRRGAPGRAAPGLGRGGERRARANAGGGRRAGGRDRRRRPGAV